MPLRRVLLATTLFVFLACYLTWPQCLYLNTQVANHDDSYFSVWRLAWIAHALKTDPVHLYDANIFYPEPRTLAYSDAVIFEGALAAPLQWAGLNPVAVYNVLLLGGMITSAIGMFVLAWSLIGSEDAALVAATIFLMLPYRVDHFMHLELQWTCWIPLTFWAVHRTFDTRSIRFGLLTGVLLWFQLLSAVYYGVFLGLAIIVLPVLIVIFHGRKAARIGTFGALAAGAMLALLLAYLPMRPYLENARTVGVRQDIDVARYSATPLSYLASPQENWWWGKTEEWSPGDELHLFPGLVALMLVAAGLALKPSRTVWIYAVLAAVLIEISFGSNGWLYPRLREHLFLLQGFRAIARVSVLALCALALIAGFGFAALQARWSGRRHGAWLLVSCLVALAVEYGSAPMRIEFVPRSVPDVYQLLRRLPRGPVAELPMPTPEALPAYDTLYMFSSIAHWYPLLNGHSGFVSERYIQMLEQLKGFPRPQSIDQLCAVQTRHVIIHEHWYKEGEYEALLEKVARVPDLLPQGQYRDTFGKAALFELHCRGSQ